MIVNIHLQMYEVQMVLVDDIWCCGRSKRGRRRK